ncbi:MAG: TerB family tellurite resistance protein [Gammaproteobacteria bacterium]
MATAVLLMEVARADHGIDDAEREVILRVIEKQHALSPDKARSIADAAEEKTHEATSLFPFTSMLNRECSLEERIGIIAMLWEVTFADGRLDAHEEHLIRRVAGLLHVPHREFIRTKLEHAGT